MQDKSTNFVALPLLARDNHTIRAYTLVDVEDLPRVLNARWRLVTHAHGPNQYAGHMDYTGAKPRIILLHRLLLDAPDEIDVDHINGDGLDNRKGNLRLATEMQNQWNRGTHKPSKCGYKGVRLHHKGRRYYAVITCDKRVYRLGTFDTPEKAAEAYNQAAIEMHGEFARLNKIPS